MSSDAINNPIYVFRLHTRDDKGNPRTVRYAGFRPFRQGDENIVAVEIEGETDFYTVNAYCAEFGLRELRRYYAETEREPESIRLYNPATDPFAYYKAMRAENELPAYDATPCECGSAHCADCRAEVNPPGWNLAETDTD